MPAAGFGARLRQGWDVTWPLLVGSLSSLVLAAADTAILGQYGTRALTAMAIAAPVVLAATAVITPLGSATQILTAQWLGAGRWDRITVMLGRTVRIGIVLGGGAVALIAVASPWLLSWIGGDLANSSGARPVLLVLLPTIPFTVVTAIGRGWLVGLGETRVSMYLAVVVNVANVVLDLLLVFGVGLGAIGSSLGTSAAAGLGVVVTAVLVRRQRDTMQEVAADHTVGSGVSELRAIAWPDMVFGAVAYGSDALIIAAVSRLDAVSLAAYRTIGATVAIAFVVAYTSSNSLSVLVGQRLGAEDRPGARSWTAPMSLLMAMGVTVVGGGALLVPDAWFSLLSGDPGVVEAAAGQRWMWLVLLPAMVMSMVLAGIIRAAGDTRSMMWIGVAAQGVFAMPLAWTLAVQLGWGLTGVVIAVVAGWVLRATLSLARAVRAPIGPASGGGRLMRRFPERLS